jgi:hypothetical protein
MNRERLRALVIGCSLEAVFLSVFLVGRGASDVFFLKWYMGAALIAGALWLVLLRVWRPGALPGWGMVFFAVLFRLTVIGLPATTSGDAFRYVWDGKVLTHGINPYRYAPDAPELASLRDSVIHPNINHPKLPTIYPPLAQLCFVAAYRIGGDSLAGMKVVNLFIELLTTWLLWVLLKRTRLADPSWVVAYAWCPLPILEFMGPAHMDALGLPWLVLFYLAVTERRPVAGGLALAGATLIKLFPVILLPFLLARLDWRKWPVAVAVFVVPVVLGYGVFMLGGVDPFVSLRVYSWNWRFNAPLFSWLEVRTGDGLIARRICLGLFVALALVILLYRQRFIEKVERLWLAFFCCGTTVFPWYLTWFAPACVAVRSFPVVWLIVTAPLTYVTELGYRVNGDWTESTLVQAVEFIPIAGWAAWSVGRGVLRWRSERCSSESLPRPARFPRWSR